jgi:hypothetical protein
VARTTRQALLSRHDRRHSRWLRLDHGSPVRRCFSEDRPSYVADAVLEAAPLFRAPPCGSTQDSCEVSGRAAGCTYTWAPGGTTRREARRPCRRPPRLVEAGGLRRPRSGSGGRWAPATTHAIPLAQGSVLAQLRRDGSPFESSGQAAGRKPRRSRALLACQQDIEKPAGAGRVPEVGFLRCARRHAQPAGPPIARSLQFRQCGVRQAAIDSAQSANHAPS